MIVAAGATYQDTVELMRGPIDAEVCCTNTIGMTSPRAEAHPRSIMQHLPGE
jgi:hypothetical protein